MNLIENKETEFIMLKEYLFVFFISMVPLIELRAAVPIALGMNLPVVPSYIVCIVGNMLPVPVIFLFARKVLEWGADKPVIGKFFTFCLEKGHKGGMKLKDCLWPCCYSWGFRCREPGHGPGHWLPVSWIWILNPVYLRYCLA